MHKFLVKLLGKPIKYYDILMSSKTEKVSITEAQVNTVASALQVNVITAIAYDAKDLAKDLRAIKNIKELPKNKKKEPFGYSVSICASNFGIIVPVISV
jgi:hypothetical protein